ncbi:hypothetical protein [Actinomadura madurae]|uniref:Rv1733c family protein n=1 Tax=Actinomadura madurae TaxID=1993 RepID=UPI0011BDDF06|nr:hypothetical protein [Actinomadura madurae]
MRPSKIWAHMNRRRHGWGFDRNDMRRAVDRRQMLFGLILLGIFLGVTPFVCVHVVQSVLHSGLQAERSEAATRYRVDATVVGVKPLRQGREVKVVWTDPDGTPRSGHFTTWHGASVGDHPKVWAGPGGVGEHAPRTHARTVGDAAAIGASTVAATGLPLLGLYMLLRHRLDQQRYRMWTEEWAHFDRRHIGP